MWERLDQEIGARRDELAIERADRIRKPRQLGSAAADGPPHSLVPLARFLSPRPPHRRHTRRSGRAGARHVHLIHAVERARRVLGEHVGQAGRKPAAGRQHHACGARGAVEPAQLADRVSVVTRGHERNARVDRLLRVRAVETGRHRSRHHVDAGWNRVGRGESYSLHPRAAAVGHRPRAPAVPVGHEEAVDVRRIEQLAGRVDADRARADKKHRGHQWRSFIESRAPRARASRHSLVARHLCRAT